MYHQNKGLKKPQSKKKYLLGLSTICLSFSNLKENTNDNQELEFSGVYLENRKEATATATEIKDGSSHKIWNQGIIQEIKWDCCPYISLEDIQKKFPNFTPGKYVNINEIKYILLFLQQQLNMSYEFEFKIDKRKPERVIITLKEKEGEKFLVKEVIIKGNRLLDKEEILEAISPVLCPISIIEKIKWLVFKRTGGIITGINIEQGVEKLAKDLGDKKLLLDLKTKMELKKDYKNKRAVAIITINEGSKYFIRNIYLHKNIKIDKKMLRLWIEKKGISNGNFLYLKEFFQAYSYFNTNIYHKIDGNYIDIYVGIHNADFSQVVEMMTYIGFGDVSMEYIYKHLKVRINEPYNRNLMAEFLYKQSIILNASITQEESNSIFNKVNIQLIKNTKEEEQNFVSFKNSSFVFQYKWTKRLYNIPNLLVSFTPELHYGDVLKIGLLINVTYRMQNLWKLQIFDGEGLLNVNAIKDGDFNNALKNISLHLLQIANHPNKVHNLRWNIAPINIFKTYHPLMQKESIKNHIYFFMKAYVQKTHIFTSGVRQIKLSNFISGKYFIAHNIKIKINPEFRYPITKYLHILGSLRVLYNNKTTDYKDEETFLHFSSISSGDMMNCLLWKSHFTAEELSKMDMLTQYYLVSKEVILSNLLFNFKLMLNYVIFKNNFPGIGRIQLSIFLFVNFVYDYTNNLQRFSYGTGVMGSYNQSAILLAVGKRYAPDVDTTGFNYSVSFENYSF